MADKPSRALVLYGYGLTRSINPTHTHLHSLASRGCCGFLSLPHSPPSEDEEARMVREFTELIDSSEAYNKMNEQNLSEENLLMPTISQRFMGMKAAIITDNPSLSSFCNRLGFTMLQLHDLVHSSGNVVESSVLASELLKLLGFEEGKVSETNQFDLVIFHVENVERVNGLVGELTNMAQSGTEVGSRLHLSVVLSFGAVLENENSLFSIAQNRHEGIAELSAVFPRQSYMMKEGKPRENVRQHCPMLVAQWQDAVTRKDMVGEYSFEDFNENGGNLVIPADRYLHELAFKLWKAPKYGA